MIITALAIQMLRQDNMRVLDKRLLMLEAVFMFDNTEILRQKFKLGE